MDYRTRDEINRAKRSRRLQLAKRRGTHTVAEWEALKARFGQRCVKCARRAHLDRDHIVPLYRGGCDCIANIQPLCAWCNAGKSGDTTDLSIDRAHRGGGERLNVVPSR